MYDIHLNENADFTFRLPENFNSGILVVDVSVNDNTALENHYVQLKNEAGEVHIKVIKKVSCWF